MRSVLRVLFNSDFFKNARFQHMKSPAEVVVGTLRLVGNYEIPRPGYGELSMQPSYMGQDLLNPPSVEGWHTGKEWINSGSLMARINFVAELIGDPSLPGVDVAQLLPRRGDQSLGVPDVRRAETVAERTEGGNLRGVLRHALRWRHDPQGLRHLVTFSIHAFTASSAS